MSCIQPPNIFCNPFHGVWGWTSSLNRKKCCTNHRTWHVLRTRKHSLRIIGIIIVHDAREMFRYLFVHRLLMTFGIDAGSMLAPLWHTLARLLLEPPFSFRHHVGSVFVSFWFPFGSQMASFWLPFVFVPPFPGSSWNCNAFSYHVTRCLLRRVPTNSAAAGPRLCRETILRLLKLAYHPIWEYTHK